METFLAKKLPGGYDDLLRRVERYVNVVQYLYGPVKDPKLLILSFFVAKGMTRYQKGKVPYWNPVSCGNLSLVRSLTLAKVNTKLSELRYEVHKQFDSKFISSGEKK